MHLSEDFILELKARSDITDMVSSYVTLKRRARTLVGLCPFHGEKTPSFTVYPENASFYCFGCGIGGDVISFIMRMENLDYIDAVKFLAQRAGLKMPESDYDDSISKLRTRIFEANREAARFYYSTLVSPVGKPGLDYLHSRALTDKTIRHFGLGYAPDSWDSLCTHLRFKKFRDDEIVAANLGIRRKNGRGIYDRFRGRVMFPIIDLRGNVIAFGGRIMTDEKPKYLNTSDTPVFKKSENLFSFCNAKNSGSRTLILCEGYMDVIAVSQSGFTNAVATLGTALTYEQAMLMKRYADEVIICYDSDEAGQKATARAIPILREAGLAVRVIVVPNGKDPDEFIRMGGENGAEKFKALIEKSSSDVEYRINKIRVNYDLETLRGKVGFLEEVSKLLAALESPIERDVYTSKISSDMEIDKNSFARHISVIIKNNRRERLNKQTKKIQLNITRPNDKINSEHHKNPRGSAAQEALLIFLINNPDCAKEISDAVKPEQFKNSLIRRYYEYILGRIQSGLDPLANVAADFSSEETSKLYEFMSRALPAASTREAMREYIKVINEESSRLSSDKIADLTEDEMRDYLKKLKKNRQ